MLMVLATVVRLPAIPQTLESSRLESPTASTLQLYAYQDGLAKR